SCRWFVALSAPAAVDIISLHDALPISAHAVVSGEAEVPYDLTQLRAVNATLDHIRKKYVEPERVDPRQMFLGALDMIQLTVPQVDRKSTRLNSSHVKISYAVFCLKKKT